MTWTTDDQDAKIFVVGNQVNPGDTNAITVHYYLDKTTTSLQTDGSIGGKVGDSVTVNPATIDGYSLAAGQNPQTLKLDAKKGQTVTFYYQADDQNNITVNLVDLNTGKQVGDPQVPAGHTGEELNLGKDSDKITIPDGYHYATPDELPVGTTQPGNLTWTTDKQDTKVYVIGNEVEKTDANAVMVHHYLESTTTALKVDDQLGGRVGGQVTAKPAEIAGYTLVDGQTEQVLTLDAKQGQTVTFYYKADDQNNITITYVDTNTGKEVGTPQQPTGHTGEELNLGKDSDKITIPDGYHYATPEELPAGTTQPGNLTWTPDKQATKVYVTGNKVGEGDTNAITVHYFVENTTKSLKADDSIGGTIGVPVTVNPAEIKGYTLVDGQTAQTIMLDAKKGQTVTFYYQADDQNNITVTLVDPKTGTQVGTPQQPAGHTGEELNLGKDSDKVTIPDGYHYATPEELPAGTTQPGNLTWTTDEQATKVYVIGNEVKETDENAVTVHHYLENTTTSLKTDDKIGGRVGVEVTASPAQINGYTLVDGQTAQTLTLDAKKGQTVTFYYKADPQNNITVTLVDPNTGKPVGDPQQPAGHTGEELDLGQDSDKITIPDGYHYATPDELPTGTTQPGNLTWTPDKQDTKVYVVGNEVKETDENAVTVHHYLESTTTSLKADDKLGGRVGGEVTAKPAEIAGYTLVDGQTAQVLTLDAKKGQTVTFYYKADGQNNITITYVDTNSNKEVGTSTPAGHTGEELNLGKDSDKITIPEGYHYATPEELPAGMEQPKNTTWTTTEQATKVYVTGNKVQDKDANAITVHYFVENTTTSLKADDSIGGTIGVPVTVTPVEIKGYTLADGQAAQTIMLDVKKGQTVTFYYQADDQKNITITYVDTDTGNPIGTSVPTGHTDEKLDLGSDSPQISVPEGYHYATPEELIETQKQPTEMTWTTDNQTAKIYVVGNTIDKSDKNAVTVHHYLTNTTTQLKADEAFGGKVGGQITVNPAEINGYTLVDGQAAKTLTFDVKEGQTVTFYYQADDQNNITVSLIDPNTNKPVGEPQQPAGHTGEELNLGKDSDKITIPEGYHYATPDELPAGTTQPGNLTWTTDKQDTKVYVVGNEVGKTDANAVTVHHYLENTTTSLKVDDQLGGRVGGEVTASPAQISGYTLVDGQTAQTLTLDAKKGQTVIFYYQADDQNNITVTLVDSNTGDQVGNPQQPAGHTGEELNLGKDSDQITIPEGYHYATPDELPIGTTQPGNLTWTTNKQDTKVYVVGNEVKETDENAVKVHHYLEGTTTSLKADDALGGRVGGKVTASPAKSTGTP
ncbi:MucBP domain-containing protein [Lentilactobacillus rapi]|uniref:MucBP domain-containing protein n=1 Tax=Lentilactobacillus rapi TaxID=481723 RepID=UPI0006CF30C1|nr:MucBP domain-containing protein [Lentilactobacillus rapi]